MLFYEKKRAKTLNASHIRNTRNIYQQLALISNIFDANNSCNKISNNTVLQTHYILRPKTQKNVCFYVQKRKKCQL